MSPFHVVEHPADFANGEDGRQPPGSFGGLKFGEIAWLAVEDFAIHEQDGVHRLILGRSRDSPVTGEVRQEGADFIGSHFLRMPLVVKQNEPFDPPHVSLFGPVGQMTDPASLGDLLEKSRWWRQRRSGRGRHRRACGRVWKGTLRHSTPTDQRHLEIMRRSCHIQVCEYNLDQNSAAIFYRTSAVEYELGGLERLRVTPEEALTLIGSPKIEDRIAALAAVEKFPAEARPGLVAILLDASRPAKNRVWCAGALARIGDDENQVATAALRQCLGSSNSAVRWASLDALGELRCAPAIEDIARLVHDHEMVQDAWDDCSPAQAAISALEKIGTPDALARIPGKRGER